MAEAAEAALPTAAEAGLKKAATACKEDYYLDVKLAAQKPCSSDGADSLLEIRRRCGLQAEAGLHDVAAAIKAI